MSKTRQTPIASEFEMIEQLAGEYGIPFIDLLLISLNMQGARGPLNMPRARMKLRFAPSPETWQVILPLESDLSPYSVCANRILLDHREIARIDAIENDDVVLVYLRAGGRAVTLNTNSRSNCIGCVFCPNIIEDAADETVHDRDGLSTVLEWLCADQEWADLSHVEKITVCTGCFKTPTAAIRHMAELRHAASPFCFSGHLHLLSSVIRAPEDIRAFVDAAGPAHLTFTLECFERRAVLLKDTKASLTVDETCAALDLLDRLGAQGDFTYVAGLDSLAGAVSNLERLIASANTFPRIQVFQAHNAAMRHVRHAEARDLSYYCDLRAALEPILVGRGLVPRYWENYRPLWATSIAGRATAGPRV